jgi:hypothetical protein
MRARSLAPLVLVFVLSASALSGCAASGEKKMVGIVTTAKVAALSVKDQPGAAGTLEIERVLTPESAWVVVHLDADGKPGERVGLLHVDAGESSGLKVDLDPAVTLTDKLIVALHADRGTPGTFDFAMDRFESSPDKPFFVDGKELATVVGVK